MRQSRPQQLAVCWSIDLEVLHTTATEQLPAFTAGLRRVLSGITDRA
jgi:hypothetical protein